MKKEEFSAKQPITDTEELQEWLTTKEAIYICGMWTPCSEAKGHSFVWLYQKMKDGEIQQAVRW